jgi:uncharacterized membrane protein
MLTGTSLDITRLHPFVTVRGWGWFALLIGTLLTLRQICWYLAAVVQIHLCKYCIEINDIEREAAAWGEINLLR